MSSDNLSKLQKYFEKLEKEPQNDISSVLEETSLVKNGQHEFRFFLVKCADSAIDYATFIDYLVASIIRYVLERHEYKSSKMNDPNYVGKIVLKARDRFIRSEKVKSGEIGELILFVLLESRGIFQVFNKMLLKTNKNMHVHGADNVNIEVKNGRLVVHFGESKMHSSLTTCITESLESIEDFIDPDTGKKFELDLVSTHLDKSKFGRHSQLIIDIIDPYYPNRNLKKTKYSVFIGYDWKHPHQPKSGSDDLCKFLRDAFEKEHNPTIDKITEAIKKSKIPNETFTVHFLPFTSVDEFVDRFRKRV